MTQTGIAKLNSGRMVFFSLGLHGSPFDFTLDLPTCPFFPHSVLHYETRLSCFRTSDLRAIPHRPSKLHSDLSVPLHPVSPGSRSSVSESQWCLLFPSSSLSGWVPERKTEIRLLFIRVRSGSGRCGSTRRFPGPVSGPSRLGPVPATRDEDGPH